MPTSYTEGTYLDELIQSELNKDSRQSFLAQGAITKGQILANGSAATQKAPIVAAGTGANSIALNDAADGEVVWTVGLPGPVVVKRAGLIYGSGATGTQKDATDALLRAVGITVLTRAC